MKCKNCGYLKIEHIDKKLNPCKQFIPQRAQVPQEMKKEDLEFAPPIYIKENQGCGNPFGWVKVKGKKEPIICDGKGNICPSCLSNSSETSRIPCKKEQTENKDPDDVSRVILDSDSGSDFNLPRLKENVVNWRIKEIELLRKQLKEKDKKFTEFIRLVNKLSVADFLDGGVNKLAGELK